LHVLTLHGGALKPTDLSKFLFRSKQTITSTVDSLERNGLVKRELDSKDRRTRKVIITKAGTNSIKKTLPRLREISNSSMPTLSEEEMKTLTATLRKIRKHLLSQIRS
jgi:DNA-binding MarR family transcriptional regulator